MCLRGWKKMSARWRDAVLSFSFVTHPTFRRPQFWSPLEGTGDYQTPKMIVPNGIVEVPNTKYQIHQPKTRGQRVYDRRDFPSLRVTMDHEYAQPTVLMFDMLPNELIAHIIVTLNGGSIDNKAVPKSGYLFPGYRGGRELHYFEISRAAMIFWKHVCKYLRHTYTIDTQTHHLLLADNTPYNETWNDPHIHEWNDYHSRERYIPRHFFAGDPKPWMMSLCYGPQSYEEVLVIEALEQAKIAAKEARKEKRRMDAGIALVDGWGSGPRKLRSRK